MWKIPLVESEKSWGKRGWKSWQQRGDDSGVGGGGEESGRDADSYKGKGGTEGDGNGEGGDGGGERKVDGWKGGGGVELPFLRSLAATFKAPWGSARVLIGHRNRACWSLG